MAGNYFAITFLLAALQQAEHGSLSSAASTTMEFRRTLRFVHIPRKSADVGLVNFDSFTFPAHYFEAAVLHRQTNPVEHEPRGFLSDLQSAMKFVRTNPVLAVNEKPRRR